MNVVCECLGGSHAYGLNNPESDLDVRGVYLNTDFKHILSLDTETHQTKVNDEEDTQHYELRRFVGLLRKGNTGALEVLFNKKWQKTSPEFEQYFCKEAKRFLTSKKLYSCLRGYGQSEHRLALGLRPGIIGAKRAEQVRKYGYSPKNFTQLIRLMLVGHYFFREDKFIVNCEEMHPGHFELLKKLKNEPGTYTADWATALYKEMDSQLEVHFNNRIKDYTFDENYAVEVLLRFYYPALKEKYDFLT